MRPSVTWLLVTVTIGVWIGGCGPGQSTGSAKPAGPGGLLASSPAFEYLPRDTRWIVAARSPAALVSKLQLDEAARTNSAIYPRVSAQLTELTGSDLLVPDNLAAVGLDAQRPFGLAQLGQNTLILFATIADHDALQTAVYRTMSKRGISLTREVVASAVLLTQRYEPTWWLAVRGQTAFLILGPRAQGESAARRIAALKIDRSLAAQPAIAEALADLDLGEDLAGYVQLGELTASRADPFALSADTPVVFGAELSPRAIRFTATLPVGPNHFVRRALEYSDITPAADSAPYSDDDSDDDSGDEGDNSEGDDADEGDEGDELPAVTPLAPTPPSLLLAATQKPLLFAVSSRIRRDGISGDTPLATELAQTLESMGMIDRGSDLARTIATLAEGELGLAAVATGALTPLPDRAPAVGLHLLAQVSDPDRAARIVSRLVPDTGATAEPARSAGGPAAQYTWPNPSWRPLHVGVAGPYLFVSTDPGFGARVSELHRTSASGSALADPAAGVLSSGQATLRLAFDLIQLRAALKPLRITLPSGRDGGDVLLAEPTGEPGASDPPESERLRELLGQRSEARTALAALVRQRAQRRTATHTERARAMGLSAIRAEITPIGLRLHGGQFFGEGGVHRAIDQLLAADDSALQDADRDITAAEERLRAIEAAIAKERRDPGGAEGAEGADSTPPQP